MNVRPVTYLHHHAGQADGPGGWRHHHSFWQLEVVLQGEIEVSLGAEKRSLRAGDVVLIPPFFIHGFLYPEPRHFFVSIKFDRSDGAEPREPVVLRGDRRARALGVFLREECARETPDTTKLEQAVALLLALADERVASRPPAPPSWADDLRRWILGRGGALRVTEVARKAGLSPGHFRVRFEREFGVGIKEFLDETRAQAAEAMLRYGDGRVGEIAEALGFSDQFAFSRFYRRLRGRSPRKFRNDEAAGDARKRSRRRPSPKR